MCSRHKRGDIRRDDTDAVSAADHRRQSVASSTSQTH